MTSKNFWKKHKMAKTVNRNRLRSNLNEREITEKRAMEVYGRVKYWRKKCPGELLKKCG